MKETLKRRVKALSLVFLVVLLTVTMLPTTAFAASKKVPSKVSVTKVSASTSSVKVSWKKAKDATSYRIYWGVYQSVHILFPVRQMESDILSFSQPYSDIAFPIPVFGLL